MRFGSAFRNGNFLPITGMTISALVFILDLIVSSRRNWHIVVGLIRVSAGTGRLVGIALRFSPH